MSQPNDPVPQRIGDADRDRATEYLREHLASGRLDQDEFDTRLDQALRARTMADLDPLFTDLPSPKPGSEVVPLASPAPVPAAEPARSPERLRFAAGVLSALLWPAAIIFCFATDWNNWWVLMIPILFSSVAARYGIGDPRRIERAERRRQRRLEH